MLHFVKPSFQSGPLLGSATSQQEPTNSAEEPYILAGEFTNPKKRWSYENSHSEFKRICQKISERR